MVFEQPFKTLDGRLPFQNSTIRQIVVNPHQLKIGQKYAYRENYQKLLENISGVFSDFFGEWQGLGNLGAYFIFGFNSGGQYSMACYIPPIIEIHGSKPLIMDGIHRNYIARQTGLTMTSSPHSANAACGVSLRFAIFIRIRSVFVLKLGLS